jgi:WD40 repeat protein
MSDLSAEIVTFLLPDVDGSMCLWTEHRGVVVSVDGRYAFAASPDGAAIRDVDSGTKLTNLEGRSHSYPMAVTHGERHAIVEAIDGLVKVWNLGSSIELRTPEGHTDSVSAGAVNTRCEHHRVPRR